MNSLRASPALTPVAGAVLALLAACRSDALGVGSGAVPGIDGLFAADPVWHDGRAEKAVYAASDEIYGRERSYEATCYTNLEHVDTRTTVKRESGGLAVLKHHWSERVPTENYDYDYSVSSYLRADGLAPFKLSVGTQEDCGASFKQLWPAPQGGWRWLESVYFPDGGLREGRLPAAPGMALFDALPCLLRAYPFDAPREIALRLLPSQRSPRRCEWDPIEARVVYGGRERVEVGLGELEAHRLDVLDADRATLATYWMDVRAAAPWLHVMLASSGPGARTSALQSLERTKYWERVPR
ncbi:MAG: hypothetical protein FJ299_03900 [Planctomycetes bacterium]|nr:hypothetical protein [Planctomycetota bacterium]